MLEKGWTMRRGIINTHAAPGSCAWVDILPNMHMYGDHKKLIEIESRLLPCGFNGTVARRRQPWWAVRWWWP